MHSLFKNVAPAIFQLWNRIFFKDGRADDYVLPVRLWAMIGQLLEKNQVNIPADFRRPSIDIHKYSAGFKAEDWSNWVIFYSLPTLHNHLPPR